MNLKINTSYAEVKMTSLERISNRGNLVGRYLVCEDGPDARSTFAECWGSTRQYDWRAVEATDSLPCAKRLVSRYGVIMDTKIGRPVECAID